MQIQLTDEQLGGLLSKAVVASLDETTRAALIERALAHLVTPPKPNGYGGRADPSPLYQAFQFAIEQVARKRATELLADNPEVQAQIDGLLREALERTFSGDKREEIVQRLSYTLADSLARAGQ